MSVDVHPTAIVSEEAVLGDGVEVGPYAVIEKGVKLGRGTRVGAHAHLSGPAEFGEGNRIFPHAVLGQEPQDLKYHGEPTRLIVGARNVFREFMTVHRGTVTGHGQTVIGDDGYFMSYSHIAHDCTIGSRVIFANSASLAGHVDVGDHAILNAFAAVHQFARIGKYAFVGAYAQIRQDVLPFSKTDGIEAKTYGINTHRPQAERVLRRAVGRPVPRRAAARPVEAQHDAGARADRRGAGRPSRRGRPRPVHP